MNVQDLAKNLQVEVKPLYLIVGGDLYYKKQAFNFFKNLVDDVAGDFNISYVNTAVTPEMLFINLQTPPLMSDYKVVFLSSDGKKLDKEKAKAFEEKIIEWVKNPCPNVVLVADSEEDCFKFLTKVSEIVDCKKQTPSFLYDEVAKIIQKNGYFADDVTIKEIITKCNNDMMIITGELAKLFAYSDKKIINYEMVCSIVVNNIEQSVFKLTDNIANGNAGEAIAIMDNLLASGEQPLKILATIISHYRRMFICKISTLSNEELAKELGVKSTYAIDIAKRLGKSYKPMQLKKLVEKMQYIEYSAKNGGIGMLDGLNLALTYALNRR